MAVTLGTNCGFVFSSPVANPGGTDGVIEGYSYGMKDTSPAGNNRVIEIGWYMGTNNNAATAYNVGIYSHDAGNNRPNDLIAAEITGQSTTANTEGWYKYTGLNIPLSASTIYWVAVTSAAGNANSRIDYTAAAGSKADYRQVTPLPSPWGVSDNTLGRDYAIYALYESVAVTPTGRKRKILRLSELVPLWIGAVCIVNPTLNRRDLMRFWEWLRK